MATVTKQWGNGDPLTLVTSAGGIAVTSAENLTGADREMTIRVQTTNQGTKAFQDVLIKQSKYAVLQDGYWVHKDTGVKTYFGADADFITGGVMSSPYWATDCSEVQMPSGVTGLGDYCFSSCIALTSITLPESVNSIGLLCFYECTSLTLATVLPAIPPSLGFAAFAGVHASFNIKVHSPYVDAYKTATNWTEYASIISAI